MAEKVQITFDEDNQIRVLEASKFRETDALKNEGQGFIAKIMDFKDIIESLIQVLEEEALKIDEEKLRAIG